ncbi:hypothetical protein SUGI_0358810 [Cryptomeria japonica]|nr:hypothetical protein SUGI_0358810 [Cryptomeria japonica]
MEAGEWKGGSMEEHRQRTYRWLGGAAAEGRKLPRAEDLRAAARRTSTSARGGGGYRWWSSHWWWVAQATEATGSGWDNCSNGNQGRTVDETELVGAGHLQYALHFGSIDSSDDVPKECFLDLELFPADRKICAEALLDTWVYVRKLQRHDAFAILSELASRNLLNLTSNARGSTTIQFGNASEVYFSQNDGTRHLDSYLGHHDNILHRKRLFIDRKDFCSLKERELLGDRAFDTQILSIFTGPVGENDWCDMNFPETEAMLLFFTSIEYFLLLFGTFVLHDKKVKKKGSCVG